MRSFRILALWLSPLAWAVMVAATCYYPDGSVAGTYTWVPCKSTGTASTCCIPSEGDVCMADGLCNWVGHYYFRGACTDSTWQDPSCAQVCQGGQCCGETIETNLAAVESDSPYRHSYQLDIAPEVLVR